MEPIGNAQRVGAVEYCLALLPSNDRTILCLYVLILATSRNYCAARGATSSDNFSLGWVFRIRATVCFAHKLDTCEWTGVGHADRYSDSYAGKYLLPS
jgi:hypothetical protein